MKQVVKYILFIVIIWYIWLATVNHTMRYFVHGIPPKWIWTYDGITPKKEVYNVWDFLDFTSYTRRFISFRIIWEDYLYCESDLREGQSLEDLKYRNLYTSTLFVTSWKRKTDWVYGRTKISRGYILKKEGTWCYVLSRQIWLPYGEEIIQEYKSHTFDIKKREVLYPK